MIDELMNELLKKLRKVAIDNVNYHEWSFNIYVNIQAYYQLMSEIRGPVSSMALELYQHNTMGGHPVHRVISDNHPPFIIYAIPPKNHIHATGVY